MTYLLCGNMDKGSVEYQLEAAISKIFSSVSKNLTVFLIYVSLGVCMDGD